MPHLGNKSLASFRENVIDHTVYPKYIPRCDLGYIWDKAERLDASSTTGDNSENSYVAVDLLVTTVNLISFRSEQGVMVIKQLLIYSFLLLLMVSCNSLNQDVVLGDDVSPTAVRGVLATIAPEVGTRVPVMATVTNSLMTPTAVPIVTETTSAVTVTEVAADVSAAGFNGLRFALTAGGPAQREFPAGTEEVYALWEYEEMSPSDNSRRIWFRNDQIWLTREEAWNWGEYGSEGTMLDISVYDNEGSGLPPATYRLQLYVNDELQAEETFVVLEP